MSRLQELFRARTREATALGARSNPLGLVEETAGVWQPRLITLGLWAVIMMTLLLSVASFVSASGRQDEPVSEATSGPDPDVTGVAERAARTWLTAQSRPLVAAQVVDVGGYGPNEVASWHVAGLSAIEVTPVGDGYWSVLVAAQVTDPTAVRDDGTAGDPVEWFLEVGVAETAHGAVAVASPAPVPPPASRTDLVGNTTRALTAVDPNNERMAAAIDFVSALLTGDPAVSRYTAPGVEVTPALPAGVFHRVTAQRASATETTDGTVIRLEVVAESPSGARMLFGYTLTVVVREDRSEVTRYGATPPIETTTGDADRAETGASISTSTMATTTTTGPAPDPEPADPESSSATSVTGPPSASGSGLDGPYETVERPGA